MNDTIQLDTSEPVAREPKVLRVVLPGFRGPFAPNDFNDLNILAADEAVAKYLIAHISRVPWGAPRDIVLQMPVVEREPERELVTAAAYRDLFRFQARMHWRQFVHQVPRSLSLVFVGVSILLLSHYLQDSNMDEPVRFAISDAVQVGGWVALWTAISAIFIDGFQSLLNYFAFRRLAGVQISFEYATEPSPLE